jgi:hypothetical protein
VSVLVPVPCWVFFFFFGIFIYLFMCAYIVWAISPLCCPHAIFVTMTLQYNLMSGIVIPSVLLFMIRIIFWLLGSIFSISLKNFDRDCIVSVDGFC